MSRLTKYLLSRLSEETLKAELKRRGYAVDIRMSFYRDGKPTELKAIGKHPILTSSPTKEGDITI